MMCRNQNEGILGKPEPAVIEDPGVCVGLIAVTGGYHGQYGRPEEGHKNRCSGVHPGSMMKQVHCNAQKKSGNQDQPGRSLKWQKEDKKNIHVRVDESAITRSDAPAPPNVTSVIPEKLLPLTVTEYPPETSPVDGVIVLIDTSASGTAGTDAPSEIFPDASAVLTVNS